MDNTGLFHLGMGRANSSWIIAVEVQFPEMDSHTLYFAARTGGSWTQTDVSQNSNFEGSAAMPWARGISAAYMVLKDSSSAAMQVQVADEMGSSWTTQTVAMAPFGARATDAALGDGVLVAYLAEASGSGPYTPYPLDGLRSPAGSNVYVHVQHRVLHPWVIVHLQAGPARLVAALIEMQLQVGVKDRTGSHTVRLLAGAGAAIWVRRRTERVLRRGGGDAPGDVGRWRLSLAESRPCT